MKLSAWHKQNGDNVEWYFPFYKYDRVYMSKVFTFTTDYPYPINADKIIKGGTGYNYPDGGGVLPHEIEHIYPDYGLYPEYTKDTAYGFMTRGCPRGCDFCIVKHKEGRKSVKVSDLSEFWRDQKNISLCDPNMFACKEWADLAEQLIASKAYIDFNQGVDIRIMTDDKIQAIRKMKIKRIHFAWDRYEDKDMIVPKFKMFQEITGWERHKMTVYCLVNFDTTLEQDLDRIYTLRDLHYQPYVMIFNKDSTTPVDRVRKLQRYVNSPRIFNSVKTFDEYERY